MTSRRGPVWRGRVRYGRVGRHKARWAEARYGRRVPLGQGRFRHVLSTSAGHWRVMAAGAGSVMSWVARLRHVLVRWAVAGEFSRGRAECVWPCKVGLGLGRAGRGAAAGLCRVLSRFGLVGHGETRRRSLWRATAGRPGRVGARSGWMRFGTLGSGGGDLRYGSPGAVRHGRFGYGEVSLVMARRDVSTHGSFGRAGIGAPGCRQQCHVMPGSGSLRSCLGVRVAGRHRGSSPRHPPTTTVVDHTPCTGATTS